MITWQGKEWYILLEEDDKYHLIDSDGNGVCVLKSEL